VMLDKRKEQTEGHTADTSAPESAAVPDMNYDNSGLAGNLTKDDLPF